MTTPIREADKQQLRNEIGAIVAMAFNNIVKPVSREQIINELETLLTKHTERAVLEEQQTSFINALQERNPADQLVILGGLLYQYLMEETNATTANITLDNFSRHGKVLGDLEIKATLKTQLEAKDERN